MPRYFTLEEARETLPVVRELMERAHGLRLQVEEQQAQLAQSAAKTLGNGHHSGNGAQKGRLELEQLVEQLEAAVRKVEEIGCLVKDLEVGLADWPHLRDGHEVYLCWRMGEPDIQYWHEIAAGFPGRQPL
jgi:hypothetical protein